MATISTSADRSGSSTDNSLSLPSTGKGATDERITPSVRAATNLQSPSYWIRQRVHPCVADAIGSKDRFVYALNIEKTPLPTEFTIDKVRGRVAIFKDQSAAAKLAEAAVSMYHGRQKIRVADIFLPEKIRGGGYRAVVQLLDESLVTLPQWKVRHYSEHRQPLSTTPPPPDWDGTKEWRTYSVLAQERDGKFIPIGLEFRGMTPRSEAVNRPVELLELMKFRREETDPVMKDFMKQGVLTVVPESDKERAHRDRVWNEMPVTMEQRVLDLYGSVVLSLLFVSEAGGGRSEVTVPL